MNSQASIKQEKYLSVIVVNYNGEKLIRYCIDSIKKRLKCSYEIIIVDNNSIDKSIDIIEMYYKDVILIKNNENTGFSKANNMGAKKAKGKYLLLLNNDTTIETSMKYVLEKLDNNTGIGIAGVKIIYPNGMIQESIGYDHNPMRIILSWLGLGNIRMMEKLASRTVKRKQKYEKNQKSVDWVSGAALLVKKKIWDEIGGMDDRYFMYIEDVDFCKQVRQKGYIIEYVPEEKIKHYEAGGKEWVGENALIYTMKSYCIFLRKYYSITIVNLVRICLANIMLVRSIIYGIKGLYSDGNIDKEKSTAYLKACSVLIRLWNY